MKTWKNLGILTVSALSLGVVACGGSDGAKGATGDPGAPGAKGDPGDSTPASVGVIVPNVGLLDRELDVTITTNGVDLTQGSPTIDVGAGVTVSAIQVLSSTTLYAHFAIDAAAATGARDVKVTEGSNTLTSKGGFKVAAPINVTATPSNPQQAGLVLLSADNLDTQHPFDATADSSGRLFGGAITYPNFALGFPDAGLVFSAPQLVTTVHAEGAIILLDPLAPATSTPTAENLDPVVGAVAETYAGDPVSIAPRSATALTVNTPLTGQNIAAAGGTNLYKYNTSALAILEVTATATGTTISPDFVLYGPGGKSADLKVFARGTIVYPVPAASTDTYVTAFDDALGGGASADYGFDLAATIHTGTAFNEPVAAHETLAHATSNAAIPALPAPGTNNGAIVVGTNSAAAEEDWYEVTLAQNDNLEVTIDSAKDITVDLTDGSAASIWDNGPLAGGNIETATQTIATAGSHPYYLHVTSTDGTAAGGYLISLRKR